MKSRIYFGRVRHCRFTPVENVFSYSMFQLYLDLGELDRVFLGRWLWSTRRPAPAWFRRADHYGDPETPLDEAIRALVEERLGRRPAGPVRLLTHLRYFGYVMNPVSFYYCYSADGETLEAVVAEIHNTPWGERHCYVLPWRAEGHAFEKEFHVSPYMAMEQTYRWRLAEPGPTLAVHMENEEGGRKLFDATLTLEEREITGSTLARALLLHPLMTGKVIAAIYWQALKLWWKGAPFHPHPKTRAAPGLEANR